MTIPDLQIEAPEFLPDTEFTGKATGRIPVLMRSVVEYDAFYKSMVNSQERREQKQRNRSRRRWIAATVGVGIADAFLLGFHL